MQISFQWNRSPGGSWRSVPTVPLGAYRLVRRDAGLAVFKPTAAALAQGFAISLLLAVFMGLTHAFAAPFLFGIEERAAARAERAAALQAEAGAMRRSMIESGVATPEAIDAAQAAAQSRIDAERARRNAAEARMSRMVGLGYYGVMSVLGAFALLAPASFLWRSVRLSRSIRGESAVAWTGYLGWPKSAQWPKGEIARLGVGARDERQQIRRGVYRTVGWRWYVAAYGQDGAPRIFFTLDRQPVRPIAGMPLPGGVEAACRIVESIWGAPCDRTVAVAEVEPDDFGFSRTIRMSRPVVTTREDVQTYSSIDDIPPHLQAQARALLEEARRTGQTVTSQVTTTTQRFDMSGGSITFRDIDGVERTYRSIDEMPPEIRVRYEDLMRRFRGG